MYLYISHYSILLAAADDDDGDGDDGNDDKVIKSFNKSMKAENEKRTISILYSC